MIIGMALDNQFFGDTRVINEALFLADCGHEVHVLCFNHGSYPKFEKYKNIKLHRFYFPLKLKNKLRPFMLVFPVYTKIWAREIQKFVKKNKIKALHIHDLYMIEAVKKAFKKGDIYCVADLHENYPAAVKSYRWSQGKFAKFLIRPEKWKTREKILLDYVDKIIVLSEFYRDKLTAEYRDLSKEKFAVYPNVPNVKEFLSYEIKEIKRPENKLTMLYFGAIAQRRGIFTVFDAILKLKGKKEDIFVWMIGPVDHADRKLFDSYSENKYLKNKIKFIPWISVRELPSYLKVTDVCLSPILKNDQHESGIANKVFQYILFEKPVIASDCLPQQKLIYENNCGLIHKSGDADDLAKVVLKFAKEKEKWIENGKNGKKAVLNKYNVKSAGLELDKIYRVEK